MKYNNYHKHDHLSNIFSPDCNVKAEDYIKKCIEYGHINYFTTNHGSFGDIFEARTLCDKYGLRCIAGIEGYIVPNPLEKDKSNYHIIIIPKTDVARKKMNYVSTHANADGFYYRPRLFLQDLLDLEPNDIFITTACIAGLLKDEKAYKNIFLPLVKHFGNNVLLEVQSHTHPSQIAINQRALKLHHKFGLRLIAANDSHYIDEKGREERLQLLHGKGVTHDDEDTFILDFPTDEEMFNRFQKQNVLSENDIETAIQNTLVFDDCEEILLDHNIKMPTIYSELTPSERVKELKSIINQRFKAIVKEEKINGEEYQKYKEGIRYEMNIIEQTNEAVHSADYFLFNTKNVDLAVNKYGGVLTRGGRGSCASFYINRILGITQLDRFKIELPIFPDRFMSVARCVENRSLPDIDYNCKEQQPFINASRELLGEHGCYPMYAPGTMQLSEAFRNVCRSKELPYDSYNTVAKDIEKYVDDPKWKDIIEETNIYIGTIISASVHPCAFALDNKDLRYEYGLTRIGDNLCVLVTSSEADEYKILKNDYLIVSVWKLIDETFKLIGKPIIPASQLLIEIKNDQRIWDLFKNGITCTLNQVDSDNGTRQAKEYGISSFEEGALIAAAIRPSFDSWRDKFLSHSEYSTGSEALDQVLSMTQHYILFQENLMQYFDWLGVSPAESISLIKKISKKKIKPEDFQNLEERIKKQWVVNTGSDKMFSETWSMIQSCMSYGFASPHAAATSLDMCYGAYLKINYPYEYYTVCFNNYAGDDIKTNKLIKELNYFGIKLSGITFGFSQGDFSFNKETRTIYRGLASIKYISKQVADELYTLKDTNYQSFVDLLTDINQKTTCNSKQLDILIRLNYFHNFGHVNYLLKVVEYYVKFYGRKQIALEQLYQFPLPSTIVLEDEGKLTAKTFKFNNSTDFLKKIVLNIKVKKQSDLEQIKTEIELLGYSNHVVENAPQDSWLVTWIDPKYGNMIEIYRLYNAEIKKTKICRTKYNQKLLGGEIIRPIEYTERFKKRKIGEDEKTHKPIFEETSETEIVLSRYKVLS